MVQPDSTYPVTIKPYKLDISQFGDKVRNEMKFTITNVSDQDLKLSLVSWPSSVLSKLDLPDKVKAGMSAEGKIELRDDALDEGFEKSFTFEVNDAAKSRFTVPIKRQVQHASLNPRVKPESPGDEAASHRKPPRTKVNTRHNDKLKEQEKTSPN